MGLTSKMYFQNEASQGKTATVLLKSRKIALCQSWIHKALENYRKMLCININFFNGAPSLKS